MTASILRACDVLSPTLPHGVPPLTDSEIFVVCDHCGDLALSALYLTLKRDITYTCPVTNEPLVIIAGPNPVEAPWKRASRVGEFVIWHAGDLHYRGARMPRSRATLREIRISATRRRRRRTPA